MNTAETNRLTRRKDEQPFGYAFDRVVLELKRGRLMVDGEEIASPSLPTKLLQALCEQPGLLISRAQLFDYLWPRQVVSDESLTKVIGRLREHLGPYGARMVTVRGKGLRLDATVRRIENETSQAEDTSSTTIAVPPTSEHAHDARTRPVILIVDDASDTIVVLSSLLKDRYQTKVATNHESAIKATMRDPKPDLILLDVTMPTVDGYEICRQLKTIAGADDIPVIFLTARSSVENEVRGFACGAVDYITKPFSPPLVLARIATHLSLIQARRKLKDQNERLELLVERRTRDLARAQDATILALAATSGAKDAETFGHVRRMQRYTELLAYALKDHPRFMHEISDANIGLLYKSASLHDLGSAGISDHVLLASESLSPGDAVWEHTSRGAAIIRGVEEELGESSDFLRFAREIAYSHHERWDGTGYPEGLAGDEIPISARLVAIADVYDALMAQRPYDPRRSHEESVATIRDSLATQFDPDVLNAFLKREASFREIFETFAPAEHSL